MATMAPDVPVTATASTTPLPQRDHRAAPTPRTRRVQVVRDPKPHLYLGIGITWAAALLWFHPRLAALMDLAQSTSSWLALAFFVVFIELAWLYGIYNIAVVVMAAVHRRLPRARVPRLSLPPDAPPVAILYTTYNDFVEKSVESCVWQDYPDYRVYILDDSTDPEYKQRVDAYAAAHPNRVTVVRRPDRRGFKAGNLNHALANVAKEPLFALVDADEILPVDFLRRAVPYLLADPECGFVQANHEANPAQDGDLPKSVAIGIDIHWRWYQPLRNRYGFVMLLGHGAIIRREAWEAVGGVPEIVSEDLAFALRLREHGWRGYFAEDIVCFEDFPDTVRAFRVRHMKWTRGTSEFLARETGRLLRARRVTWTEKLDILFPTLGLPLALFWFIYLIDANLILAWHFGIARPLTVAVGAFEWALPTWGLDEGFSIIYGADFVLITLATFTAPVLSFVVDLWPYPRRLLRFLAKSTTLYASLGPLSFLGVLSYVMSGKATFLVTGDTSGSSKGAGSIGGRGVRGWMGSLHPDQRLVQGFEVAVGLVFVAASLWFFQPTTLGLAVGFLLLPFMHRAGWDHGLSQKLVFVPLAFIVLGLSLGGLGLLGAKTVMFGYGFHF
jgi:cellulose synthase/poly-beta-1,6-N-acetylglucosamine synthase-like glycosyltransferase